MKSHSLLTSLVVLSIITLAACGGGSDAPKPAASEPPAPARDMSNPGSVTGTVVFNGEVPAAVNIQMAADPYCLAAHTDEVVAQPVMVSADGAVSDVVIYVKEGLDGVTFPAGSGEATIDQSGCLYSPRAVAMRADETLTILNSDNTLHNINVQPTDNAAFNLGQPVQGMRTERNLPSAEVGIPVRCDVHPWMSSSISVFDHPHFAVTGADGSFSFDGLPQGNYVIEAGHATQGAQSQSVTIGPNEAVEVAFTFGG